MLYKDTFDKKEGPFPPLFGMALIFHTAKKYISTEGKEASDIANFLRKFTIDEYIKLQIDFVSFYHSFTGQIKINETLNEIIELVAQLMHFSRNEPQAFDYFNEALGYIKESKYSKGIKLIKKSIDLSPYNPIYMFDLYRAFQESGNTMNAMKIRKEINQKVRALMSLEHIKKEFGRIKQQFKKQSVMISKSIQNYNNIVGSKKGVITLISKLTTEIAGYLKGDDSKLNKTNVIKAIDDCIYYFELISLVASLIFFKLRYQYGDDRLTTRIKDIIVEILGWEPEPLPSIQTPSFLSPKLRKKAWLTTLGMDVLSGKMMNSIQEARYVHMDGDLGNDNPETHVWYSKDTGDQMSIGKLHAIHDKGERDKVEEHIEAHFGEPLTIIHDKGDQIVHIDIYVYPPTKERPFGMMITSGMSERPMNAPPDAWRCWPVDINKVPENMREALSCKYAELIVKLPPDWPLPKPGGQLQDDEYLWPIEELHHLIKYVHRENQCFWDGHI